MTRVLILNPHNPQKLPSEVNTVHVNFTGQEILYRFFFKLMSMGGSLFCAEGRGGHSPCNAQKCPYVAAGRPCPYSEPKTEPKDRLVPIGHLPPTPDFKKGDVWPDKPKVEEN